MKKDTTTKNEELNSSTFNSEKSKGLEELKRMAYENACCRCQYYIDKKCSNNGECVWKTIEKGLKAFDIVLSKVQLGGFIDSLQKTKNYEEYKNTYITLLTEEEYNLLKEIL